MDFHREHTLFSPSGCLTEDGLLLHKLGMLPEDDKVRVRSHLESCELCSAAVEGYGMADTTLFSGDVEMLNLESTGMAGREDAQKPVLTGTVGIEGPRFPRLSREEISDFAHRMQESVPGPETTVKNAVRKSFLNRYQAELIAAVLLLLIGIGSRQVYLQLKLNENNSISAVKTPDSGMIVEERADQGSHELPAVPGNKSNNPPSEKKASEQILFENDVYDTELSISAELSVPIEDDNKAIAGVEAGAPALSAESEREIQISSDSFISVEAQSANATKTITDSKAPMGTNESVDTRKSRNSSKRNQAEEEEVAEAEIFTVVEESPQFPGGDEARLRFLTENIRYPQEAREASIQGTVHITFVVEKDGSIGDVRVLRGIGGGCDEEAVRVIRKMPRWLPGKQRGKPVRVQFNMPIKFSMAG
ncbi:MAG: energy transducer TonB [Lentimicrobium sp.]